MTQKTRQDQLFTGDVYIGDDDSPAVKSSAAQAQAGTVVDNMVTLSQAQYDAIGTPDPQTVYIITS